MVVVTHTLLIPKNGELYSQSSVVSLNEIRLLLLANDHSAVNQTGDGG